MFNPKIKPMLFSTLKGYDKSKFLKDLIAGIIVAIIALPLSIALAIASGVSPEKGIHTAMLHTASKYKALVRFYYGCGFYIKSTSEDRGYVRALFIKEY